MALRTHFNQPEIGCPGIAEFTVQCTEALFDHITGLRQIPVTFGCRTFLGNPSNKDDRCLHSWALAGVMCNFLI